MKQRLRQMLPLPALPRVPASATTQRPAGPDGADFNQVPVSPPARRLEVGKPDDAIFATGDQALQEGRREEADQDTPKKAPPAGCAEAITWVPKSPVPTDIHADDALEFATKMDQALGAVGHTQVGIDVAPTVAQGRMTRVGLTVESSIIRPRWAGGRPSDADRKLIKKVEAFVKGHEERHRDLSRSVMQQAVCDALNQPVARAEAILEKAVCDKEPSAQEALDATEGKLEWVKASSGAVVDFKPVGVKADYHVADCKLFGDVPADGASQDDEAAP